MSLTKKTKSPEQIKVHEEQKRLRRVERSLTTLVVAKCKEIGLQAVRYQLEFLEKNPSTKLPTELSHANTVACYKSGIEKYIEGGGQKNSK